MRRQLAVFIFVLAVAAPSWAQTLFQGRIDVTVLDAQGNAVPGVLVEIAGPTPMSQITDSLRRSALSQPLAGHLRRHGGVAADSTLIATTSVDVAGGRSVPLKITLQVSGVTEAVQVTARVTRRRPWPPDHHDQRVRTTSCRSCRRRAIRGSCCRRFPASSSIA